jgi:peptidylprolyl isomerase
MKMKKRSLGIFIIALVVIIAIIMVVKTPGNNNMANQVKLETNHGDIIIELYLEEMPITAGNFKKLVEEGFYDGIIFHRIIQDFMLQGGDPTGTGTGGPGYKIQDEFTNTAIDQNNRGTLSMANAGPNTGGSQFFINLVDNNFLDGKHPVFGKVTQGLDIMDAIAQVQTNAQDRPLEEVKIIKASMI